MLQQSALDKVLELNARMFSQVSAQMGQIQMGEQSMEVRLNSQNQSLEVRLLSQLDSQNQSLRVELMTDVQSAMHRDRLLRNPEALNLV